MRINIIVYFFTIITLTHGLTYESCSLLKEIVQEHVFTVQDAIGFVCMADKISGLNTVEAGSNHGFGIFGIQPGKACEFSKPGLCGFKCDKLLDDDIEDDLSCLEIILDRNKKRPAVFKDCEANQWKPYVDDCLMEMLKFTESQRKEKGKYFNLKNFRHDDKYYKEQQDLIIVDYE